MAIATVKVGVAHFKVQPLLFQWTPKTGTPAWPLASLVEKEQLKLLKFLKNHKKKDLLSIWFTRIFNLFFPLICAQIF